MKFGLIIGFMLVAIFAIAGYHFTQYESYTNYRKKIYPCEHLSLSQTGNVVKIFCPTWKGSSFRVDLDESREKVYIIRSDSGQASEGPVYLNLPDGTKGYLLCYKSTNGEYCTRTID